MGRIISSFSEQIPEEEAEKAKKRGTPLGRAISQAEAEYLEREK